MHRFCIVLMFVACVAALLDTKDVVFVILSQENRYHLRLAENLKQDIHKQAERISKSHPIVHLSHSDFPHPGGWTILPLIPRLANLHKGNSSWIVFLEDRTKVNLNVLLDKLIQYNSDKEIWVGHALYDKEASIIHHFAFYDNPSYFKYPNVASGFAMSVALVKRLSERIKKHNLPPSDFNIDNSHELALFVWDNGKGPMLVDDASFCIREESYCAAYPTTFQICGEPVAKESIYFAVKTCEKYHGDRVPVVKKTWARHAARVKFFSDVEDDSIPTATVGIPNSEQGHCRKTVGILRYVADEIRTQPQIKWIVVADDDTILSVSRMQQLLTCYDSDEMIALGERYGYNVQNMHNHHGYNYITGGGGMVFSRSLLEELVRPELCECPSLTTPDDMYLGICIARLGVTVTHSPLFHQARPADYAQGFLETEDAVSFHKHWMIDPINVYKTWFSHVDSRNEMHVHNEL
ncbi:beta-1,3-glucosyltransferase isoform X4 [Aethina tumida]|uniref:beta-1,3-glucosyltransferase isoform X1 n=1 Tax=Aethina tumida TaxID=116153 RepID=UPI00096B3CF1|nr:beta-1,3-glucosyltransferase isoform X1 [Aethina tumida]XP_049823016.1 beta-1,3-glucosyltransferase isoform X2 [Aethina tumida]XP_049823018.1 beta-1,3-glucosyltransferase isoform X4 [Aethina tumida]